MVEHQHSPHVTNNINVNQPTPASLGVLERDWSTALVLSFFLGWLGIDQFYLGKTGKGILKLFTLGLFGILWLIDFIMIATKSVGGIVWRKPKAKSKGNANWFKDHKVASAVLGVILLIIIIAVATSSNNPTNTKSVASVNSKPAATTSKSTTSTTSTPAKSTTPAATTTTTPAPQPTVLLNQSGSGQAQTASFTTGKSWSITYTFDCSSFGSQGNFQIYIDNTDGSYNTDTGANDLAMNGGNTDYYYDAGSHYLQINSECDWTVTVKNNS